LDRQARGDCLEGGTLAVREQPRVLQVVLSLNPGGTERLVIELVARLRGEAPMAVCCLDAKGSWASELESGGVRVTALERHEGFRPALGRGVAAAAREHGATVVHCHHYSPFVYGCLARMWEPRLRVVFTEHGRLSDAGPSSKRRLANRALAKAPRGVFAVSEDVKRHIVAEGFSNDQVEVIYNGVDPGCVPSAETRARVRAGLGLSDDVLVLATVARLDPVKDLGTLLRATQEVARARAVALVIVGDGTERSTLEDLASQLGIRAITHFLGQRNDARDWLATADVYVNSSISEGVSLTILEAMAAGLPVVATRVGGTPEVINEACGRLVPARNPSALAIAVRELAAAPETRAALGSAARRRLEDRFALDRMVHDYLDVYRRVA